MSFLNGFLICLAMVLFVGPVLFTILQITLEKGLKAGISCAIGVFISDVVCVLICLYAANTFLAYSQFDFWISIIGIIILLLIGIKYILAPNLNTEVVSEASKITSFTAFSKGFLVNLINPFVFGVWLAVIGIAKQSYTADADILTYLIGATSAVLFTDVAKVLLAEKIRKYIQPSLLAKLYKICGILLIIFSFRIIYHLLEIQL